MIFYKRTLMEGIEPSSKQLIPSSGRRTHWVIIGIYITHTKERVVRLTMEAILAERIRTSLNFVVGLSTSPVSLYIKGEATLSKLKNLIRKFLVQGTHLFHFFYI